MFEIDITQKILTKLSITNHFITNPNLIYYYYNDYLEYQSRSEEVLLSYRKGTLFLLLGNGFLKLRPRF